MLANPDDLIRTRVGITLKESLIAVAPNKPARKRKDGAPACSTGMVTRGIEVVAKPSGKRRGLGSDGKIKEAPNDGRTRAVPHDVRGGFRGKVAPSTERRGANVTRVENVTRRETELG